MTTFREAVMEALDDFYQRSGGDTPDHILIEQWRFETLREANRLEQLSDKDGGVSGELGYMGMQAWPNTRMNASPEVAILLSDDTFWSAMPKAKDFYDRRP
jgi:hypothetical protein